MSVLPTALHGLHYECQVREMNPICPVLGCNSPPPSDFGQNKSKNHSLERLHSRYRTIFLKRFIQDLVFKGILKGQEFKSRDFFEGPRRFRGPQKSEKFNFSKRINKSVDHKFKSFAISCPQISIWNLKLAQF